MEIIAQEKGFEHTVFVVKANDRMAVLVMKGKSLEHAETVGCLDNTEAAGFVEEARQWLTAHGLTDAPAHRSGEHVVVRPVAAKWRATA